MDKFFKKHLTLSNCTYLEHLTFALYAGVLLLWAGIASIIHAIVPSWFEGTAAYIVIKLYKERLESHPNPTYKEWVNNGTNRSNDN